MANEGGREATKLPSFAPLERLEDGRYLATIPSGELRLRLTREEIPLAEALDFAARNNANRKYLFVSRLLGRHLPTRPARLRIAAAALAKKLHAVGLAEPCLFIGMAETATTLAQAVFREWTRLGGRGLYIDTTRRRTGGAVAMNFTEDHSHAPGHAVHQPGPSEDPEDIFGRAETLVVVDDEMTTGRTAVNLARAYEALRGKSVAAHLAVLVRWAAGEPVAGGLHAHALIEGDFEFVANSTFVPKPLGEDGDYHSVPAPRGARHGVARPQDLGPLPASAKSGERVLVVGVGEFGFAPLLLAEAIEAAGGEAYAQATTRSPVALGGAVGHARTFPALTGEGYTEFLYNVPDDHPYDRVILCCEDELPPTGHPIWELPRVECRRLTV